MRYVIVKPKLIGYKILMTSPAKKKKNPTIQCHQMQALIIVTSFEICYGYIRVILRLQWYHENHFTHMNESSLPEDKPKTFPLVSV